MHHLASVSCRFDRRRLLRSAAASSFAVAALAAGGPAFADTRPARPRAASRTDESPHDALEALLALVPGSVANDAVASGVLFYHADLKTQFDALGVDRTVPGWLDAVPIGAIMIPLAAASTVFRYGMVPELVEALGFSPFAIDRSLDTGVPPDSLSILQASFDRERMEAAWEKAGFQPVELGDDLTMWSKGEDGDIDLRDPVMQFGAGALNNLLLLDDQTLVISRMGATVRAVAKQAGSGAPERSMVGMPQVATVVRSMLPTTASSIVVGPQMLLAPVPMPFSSIAGEATPEQVLPGTSGDGPMMPTALLAAFGVEAGAIAPAVTGTPPALPGESRIDDVPRAQVRLAMASSDDAERAVKVVAERWETLDSPLAHIPYAEIMALLDAEVSADEPTVAAFDFDQGEVGNRWQSVIMSRDVLPFTPGSL